MYEIKFYKSPWKALRLLLLSSPFIVLSSFDIFSNHSAIAPAFLNWFCLCLFGLAIPLSLFNLFDRRPQIIINTVGIYDKMSYRDFINWNLIKDVYLREVHNQTFICLVLDDAALPLLKTNFKMKKISKAMGFQEINLSIGQLSNDNQKIIKTMVPALIYAEPIQRENLLKAL